MKKDLTNYAGIVAAIQDYLYDLPREEDYEGTDQEEWARRTGYEEVRETIGRIIADFEIPSDPPSKCRFCGSDDIRTHYHNTGVSVVELDGYYCVGCGKTQ